ncbi:MAG: TetR/AcrR family transcriptional regulator [Cytophagales bacterium]|nr:TetR/AcrR family transcriptional regulator [Cytophagales bacterium]
MNKAKRTKRYIIEKTSELFNKQGFKGTSLSDLTVATKLTKGSIYGNFSSKEEVALAAFNHNYQNLIKKFSANLAKAPTSKAKLATFLDTYEEIYTEIISSGGCPILNNAVDADDTNSKLNNLSVKAFYDWNQTIRLIMNAGKSTGEFSRVLNSEYYADLFLLIIEGGLVLAKSTGEKRYFRHALQHLRIIVSEVF